MHVICVAQAIQTKDNNSTVYPVFWLFQIGIISNVNPMNAYCYYLLPKGSSPSPQKKKRILKHPVLGEEWGIFTPPP